MELSEKKQVVILGLVAGKSKTECAKLADCAESTIFEWLKDETFRKALKDAKDRVFDAETARLYGLLSMVIESYKRGLRGKAKAVEIRSAVAVVTQVARFRETDLLERIERLEEILEVRK